MRRAITSALLFALAGCGGLENVPLTLGVIRGSLVGADANASVSVLGTPELAAKPDATGAFQITNVPQGNVELLAIISATTAVRMPVTVRGGAVAELGQVHPGPSGELEVEARAPSGQSVLLGKATIKGTTLSKPLNLLGEAEFRLAVGCYVAEVDVPGLGAAEKDVCVVENVHTELEVQLAPPDGSKGREGCSVSGCLPGLSCQADGSCGF